MIKQENRQDFVPGETVILMDIHRLLKRLVYNAILTVIAFFEIFLKFILQFKSDFKAFQDEINDTKDLYHFIKNILMINSNKIRMKIIEIINIKLREFQLNERLLESLFKFANKADQKLEKWISFLPLHGFFRPSEQITLIRDILLKARNFIHIKTNKKTHEKTLTDESMKKYINEQSKTGMSFIVKIKPNRSETANNVQESTSSPYIQKSSDKQSEISDQIKQEIIDIESNRSETAYNVHESTSSPDVQKSDSVNHEISQIKSNKTEAFNHLPEREISSDIQKSTDEQSETSDQIKQEIDEIKPNRSETANNVQESTSSPDIQKSSDKQSEISDQIKQEIIDIESNRAESFLSNTSCDFDEKSQISIKTEKTSINLKPSKNLLKKQKCNRIRKIKNKSRW